MTSDERAEAAVLPLPATVDTPAVVLLHLLVGSGRPVVLDAADVREVEPAAARLLAGVLRGLRAEGVPARVANAGPALRRALDPALLAGAPAPWPDGELLFVCPDRDALGFQPSLR